MSRQTFRSARLVLETLEDRDLPSSSLAGVVFDDGNNNGVKDPGEAGLAGVQVRLQGESGRNQSVSLRAFTDANGLYSFDNLIRGQYSLTAADPSGYVDGSVVVGTAGGIVGQDSVSQITLGNNTVATGYNFGELARSAGWTSIDADFEGGRIRAGTTIWFSSALRAEGVSTTETTTLQFVNQSISYVLDGSVVTIAVPDSTVVYSPTATSATTAFDADSNSWVTTLPSSFAGLGFLGGVAVPVSSTLPAGIDNVTWTGQMTADAVGVSVRWRWTAEVYSQFSTDYNALNVKPVNGRNLSVYQNNDQAGTPEAFERFDVNGALNGEFTRSARVTPVFIAPEPPPPPPPTSTTATLTGFVRSNETGGIEGITVQVIIHEIIDGELEETTLFSTTTNTAGTYTFGEIPEGTYFLRVVVPPGDTLLDTQVGTVDGDENGTDLGGGLIGEIVLEAGDNAIDYGFFLLQGE